MTTASPILIPLLNPNEPQSRLASLHVGEGQPVEQGAIICTLETTKSTADLTADQKGFVVGLRFREGQTVHAGDILAYLADSPHWTPPPSDNPPLEVKPQAEIPQGLRITSPALALAREQGVDLELLPKDRLVTESVVRDRLGLVDSDQDLALSDRLSDLPQIILYGGGGHAKMLIDLMRALGAYRIAGVIDDGLKKGTKVIGIPVLGSGEYLAKVFQRGVRLGANAVGGIGDLTPRVQVFQRLATVGFAFPSLVHKTAFVEESASLAPGSQVFAQAYVGSQSEVGFGCIVNTGAIVSHDCRLGKYTNISPGAMLAGEVQTGDGVLIGMGVTINLGVMIGAQARLGNGATVKADVPEGAVVRAGSIWPA